MKESEVVPLGTLAKQVVCPANTPKGSSFLNMAFDVTNQKLVELGFIIKLIMSE